MCEMAENTRITATTKHKHSLHLILMKDVLLIRIFMRLQAQIFHTNFLSTDPTSDVD